MSDGSGNLAVFQGSGGDAANLAVRDDRVSGPGSDDAVSDNKGLSDTPQNIVSHQPNAMQTSHLQSQCNQCQQSGASSLCVQPPHKSTPQAQSQCNQRQMPLYQDTSRAIASSDPLVADYCHASRASNTRRAYDADLRDFEAWGGTVPGTPQIIASYLAQSAAHLRPVTLRRRLAALASAHRDADLPDPTKHVLVRRVLQGIERRHATLPHQVAPLLLDDLVRIVALMGSTPQDVADRALLLVGFFGALRRSELVGLDHGDVQFSEDGLTLQIRKSKTDQRRLGRTLFLPRLQGPLDPGTALYEWLECANIRHGAIFRGGDGKTRLSDRAVARIVKKWTARTDLDPRLFSGHSLRAGFATSAALAGWDASLIARQTGHKSQDMVAAYVRPQL